MSRCPDCHCRECQCNAVPDAIEDLESSINRAEKTISLLSEAVVFLLKDRIFSHRDRMTDEFYARIQSIINELE